MEMPEFLSVDLIVVDNGSTDNTAEVVRNYASERIPLLYLYEKERGKAHACNVALTHAKGQLLLWTDDDVRVPSDWLLRMTAPLLAGEAEGVSGRIRMAGYLERKWMRRTHYFRLADNRFRAPEDLSMVGANMAFVRSVLEKVPLFEPELGPGRLGQRDDTLFSHQMLRAGFRIRQSECEVEHHFESFRLKRRAWLQHGEASGRSSALVSVQWEKKQVRWAAVRELFWRACLGFYRMCRPFQTLDDEGCHFLEIRIVEQCAFFSGYRKFRKELVLRSIFKKPPQQAGDSPL